MKTIIFVMCMAACCCYGELLTEECPEFIPIEPNDLVTEIPVLDLSNGEEGMMMAMGGGEPIIIPDGTILQGNVTWEGDVILEGSVYLPVIYSTDDIVRFRIKPGTTIYADSPNFDSAIVIPPGHIIEWNATPENGTIFIGHQEEPGWSNWEGIVFLGEPAKLEMQYCSVVYAFSGISFYGKGDLQISNNLFWACCWGLWKSGAGKLWIMNNEFINCYYAGVEAYMESWIPADANAIPADINQDKFIDGKDIEKLSVYWLNESFDPCTYPGDANEIIELWRADVNKDGLVNYYDYIVIKKYWWKVAAELKSDASPFSEFIIGNNTINGCWRGGLSQYYGIILHGVEDEEKAGLFEIMNNIIAGSDVCVSQVDGYMYGVGRRNNAYGNGGLIYNEGNPFDDIDEVILAEDPFYYGWQSGWPMLKQNCPLIDAGYLDISKTPIAHTSTSISGSPDVGQTDIGFHWTWWPNQTVGLIGGDINGDGTIDHADLCCMAVNWLTDPNTTDPNELSYSDRSDPNYWGRKETDINQDMIVNYLDFVILQKQWLQSAPAGVGVLKAKIDSDLGNIEGIVNVNFEIDATPHVSKILTLIDGLLVNTYNTFAETEYITKLDTTKFDNGLHEIKFVGLRRGATAICTSPLEAMFNNPCSRQLVERGENFTCLSACIAPDKIGVVRVIEPGILSGGEENLVYEAFFDTDTLVIIPDSELEMPDFPYSVIFSYEDEVPEAPLGGGETIQEGRDIKRIMKKEFDPKDYPHDAKYSTLVSIGNSSFLEDFIAYQGWIAEIIIRESEEYNQHCIFILPDESVSSWGILTAMDNFDICNYIVNLDYVSKWDHFGKGDYAFRDIESREIVDRQFIFVGHEPVFSHLYTDYEEGQQPYGLEPLREELEEKHSMRELGFCSRPKLTWVNFKCYFSATTTEFPEQLGMLQPEQPYGGSIYCGWKIKFGLLDKPSGKHYNEFDATVWEYLGSSHNLNSSVNLAIDATNLVPSELYSVWASYGVLAQYAWLNHPYIDSPP